MIVSLSRCLKSRTTLANRLREIKPARAAHGFRHAELKSAAHG
jgi:hypothetical protein